MIGGVSQRGDVAGDEGDPRRLESAVGVSGCLEDLHWHGAAPENFMAHIALYEGTAGGDGATWLEHVTDQQYQAAAAAIESN